jgi:predicted PurR-regulated permease PerM
MKPQKHVSSIPNAADRHLWQIQPIRDAAWIVVLIGIVWLGYAMRSVTVPLLVALLLAYLFEPVISVMQRRLGFSRPIAAGSVLGVGGVSLLLVIALTVPLVVGQTISFVDAVRKGKYNGAINHALTWAPETIQPELKTVVGKAESWLGVAVSEDELDPDDPKATNPADDSATGSEAGGKDDTPTGVVVTHVAGEDAAPSKTSEAAAAGSTLDEDERIRRIVQQELARQDADRPGAMEEDAGASGVNWFGIVGSGVSRVWGVILGVVELGLLTFLIPFYFFMFSVGWPKVVEFGRGMIMESHRERSVYLLREMDKAVSGFVRGRIVICAILAVVYAIGWTIVGVPYAIPLGIIVGIFTLVPYLGGIGLPISIGLLFADQFSASDADRMAWWAILLWPSVIFVVGQFLDDYVLTPLIAGRATNLDPVTIVVAILAGGAMAGLYGMLIAIPVAACIKILLREVLMPRIRDWVAGRVDDPLPIDE